MIISPLIYNSVGTMGVILCIAIFLLLQTGHIRAEQLTYSLVNLIGSLLILFSLCFAWNLSAAMIEIAWSLISFYGLLRWYRRRL